MRFAFSIIMFVGEVMCNCIKDSLGFLLTGVQSTFLMEGMLQKNCEDEMIIMSKEKETPNSPN